MSQDIAQMVVAIMLAAVAIGFALHYRDDQPPPRDFCPECDAHSRANHPTSR